MKKILVLSMFFLIAHAFESPACPSNGTVFPKKKTIEGGYEYNMLFERQLGSGHGTLESSDHFYTFSYGIYDWLSLDGKLGLGSVMHRESEVLPKLDYDTVFAGAYGFRVNAYEYDPWGLRFIWGFQHVCVHPRARNIDGNKYDSILDDWQMSAVMSKKHKWLTAYAGIKGSDCEMIYRVNDENKKRRYSKHHAGLIIGLEGQFQKDRMKVGAEGRFGDETAFSTSVTFIF